MNKLPEYYLDEDEDEDEYEDEDEIADPGYGDEDDEIFDGLTLYFIRGLPGAGKTSFANSLAENLGINYFEADQYFKEFNEGRFEQHLLKDAHSYCFDSAEDNLIDGYSVIVSNTSSSEREISDYEELAERVEARFISMIIENRHRGNSNKEIPNNIISNMRQRFSISL